MNTILNLKNILELYSNNNYRSKKNDAFTTVGGMFDLQDYGIIMKKGHPMRDIVSMKVLSLIESDQHGHSQQKWFGKHD